jgi:hypothetical protein
MLTKRIKTGLRRFFRDELGNASIEAVIFIPLMLTVLTATFTFHDAFRQKSLNTKAAFTISDALSRETDPINDAYLDGMVEMMEYLTRSSGPYSLRVSVVRYNAKQDKYLVDWSRTRGDFARLRHKDLPSMYQDLPKLLHNERIIVVETGTDYSAPFFVDGFVTDDLFYNMAFTRPRFAPQLMWQNG